MTSVGRLYGPASLVRPGLVAVCETAHRDYGAAQYGVGQGAVTDAAFPDGRSNDKGFNGL